MSEDIELHTFEERPDLVAQVTPMTDAAWPEFMHHVPSADRNWASMLQNFRHFQLMVARGDRVVAVVNAVPLVVPDDLDALPDEGFDWGFDKAFADLAAGRQPNALMGIQVVVDVKLRRQGLSRRATQALVAHARRHGIAQVVIPVRPNGKADYPLIPMEDYIGWRNADGDPFDNWLRTHIRLGGRIVRVCPRAMRVPGTIADWQSWTGQRFPGSGNYVVSGALAPVRMDLERDEGLYVEPNVWVVHQAAG